MATAASIAEVQQAYIAYYGRPADPSGLAYWAGRLEEVGGMNNLIDAFASSPESSARFGGLSPDASVDAIYQQLFGRSAEPAGKSFYVSEVLAGKITLASLAMTIANGATGSDKVALENKLTAAQAFTDALDTPAELALYSGDTAAANARAWLDAVDSTPASVVSANASLNATIQALQEGSPYTAARFTTGVDMFAGSDANDLFVARIHDNSNTFQSGDVVFGGRGTDTIQADIGNSQNFAITVESESVEVLSVRVQADQRDSADNNIAGVGIIDAERMSGIQRIESNNSRADLIVEDVRIQDSEITKDITIAMVDTDPGQVDLAVYFDQASLRKDVGSENLSNSKLFFEVLDTRSAADDDDTTGKLENLPFSGIRFTLGGETVQLDWAATEAAIPTDFDGLLAAVQAALAASSDPRLADVTAAFGELFERNDTEDGAPVTGTTIVLTNAGQAGFGSVSSFVTPDGSVPGDGGYHTFVTNTDPESDSSARLITSTVVLDNVGRGSMGGDLVIGGLSVGDTSGSRGVERFEITVEDSSQLQTINSTNNTLREVTIVNAEGKTGGLTVTGAVNGGDAAMPGSGGQHNAFGFSDVRLIDASTFAGRLNLDAELTDAVVAKYMSRTDTDANPAADNSTTYFTKDLGVAANSVFSYTLGGNNDSFGLTISKSNLEAAGTTNREDFELTIDGGAGNDVITTIIGDGAGTDASNWYLNSKANANLTIDGGAGNDTITTRGAGDFVINAGAGNDTVYTDNIGVATEVATWLVHADNRDLADLQADTSTSGFMYNGKLMVTFSGATVNAEGGLTSGAADSFDKGFESAEIAIPFGENYNVTQLHINQAIKEAINGDAVLSKLLSATDGPANALVIRSKIDGQFNSDDLLITVASDDVSSLDNYTEAEQDAILTAFRKFSNDSSATIAEAQAANAASVGRHNAADGMSVNQVLGTLNGATVDGIQSAAASDNTINLGTGDDVLVLGTGAQSQDTVVFNGYELGYKTIVNLNLGDELDFSSYLISQRSDSGSVTSREFITETINTDRVVEANSITLVEGLSFNETTNTFGGLDAAKLLAALNGEADSAYAGITGTLLDAATFYTNDEDAPSTLVGGNGYAVVAFENNLNDGEYKVFELRFDGTDDNADGDFSAARLIATIDGGDSLNTAAVSGGADPGDDGGGNAGGGGGGGAGTAVNVSAAGAQDASGGDFDFAFTAGTYTYEITGFGAGDTLDFPDAVAASVLNDDFNDGEVQLTWANAGQVVTVNLVGIPLANEAQLSSVAGFNALFGDGTIV